MEAVKRVFYKHAATQYKDIVYEVKDKWLKKKEQDLSVPDHVFQKWQRRWEDPDYRKRCKKQSSNRRSERAGEGSGMSTHTCGSRSMREHERALIGIISNLYFLCLLLCELCSIMPIFHFSEGLFFN